MSERANVALYAVAVCVTIVATWGALLIVENCR